MNTTSDSSQVLDDLLALVNETKTQLMAEMDRRFQQLQKQGLTKDDITRLLDNKIQMITAEFNTKLKDISKSISSVKKQLSSFEGQATDLEILPVGDSMVGQEDHSLDV
ncbi:uncharacterized protein LOC117116908 [Anneissia japonica]|uniref:uncharacterized protein LOC117116908 n=1 Tax=Anneissia japonica TaxID=1529436 RepID=UPI001425A64E|nr:uncharacterized protein LOC117116908 [Anneissia japonica]